MTVKQLIAKLNKLPSNAPVYLADHDHAWNEYNGQLDSIPSENGNDMLDEALHEFETVVILSV